MKKKQYVNDTYTEIIWAYFINARKTMTCLHKRKDYPVCHRLTHIHISTCIGIYVSAFDTASNSKISEKEN